MSESKVSLSARIDETARAAREKSARGGAFVTPRVGLVLGSGLGSFGDTLDELVKVPYHELPHLPTSTVVGHSGHLCFGKVGGVPVVCMQGRVHLYEGHPVESVVHGARTMARLGVASVFITNAAGGIESGYVPGDLMLLSDHLNLTGQNPLVGPNDDTLGTRFPDMSTAYDLGLREAAHRAAKAAGFSLREGIYAGLLGPTYETPAEVRMLRTLGAQAVGMSTVLETVALRHMKVKVAALSCITNLAAGISKTELDHAEVEQTARGARDRLVALLRGFIAIAGAV